jgi:hypothetical protein
LIQSVNQAATKYRVNTNLTEKEILGYCDLFANYSQFTKKSVSIQGETKIELSHKYFVPDYNVNKNIFK